MQAGHGLGDRRILVRIPTREVTFLPSTPLNEPVVGPTEIRIQLVGGEPSIELELSFIPRD